MTRVERRAFLFGTLSLLAAPLAAGAQQVGKVYRIDSSGGSATVGPAVLASRRSGKGSVSSGGSRARNLVIEYRSRRASSTACPTSRPTGLG